METGRDCTVLGADLTRTIDLLLVNAPLRDYGQRPRVNDFTLPVLGLGYIATYAAAHGFNIGVIDAESLGLSLQQATAIINRARPRWVGFNLLAPTYRMSASIAAGLDPTIKVMVGGHHAKAMPGEVLRDPCFRNRATLIMGEAETRVVELLHDERRRADLPGVMWIDPVLKTPVVGGRPDQRHHLAPDVDTMPYVDRSYFVADPYRARDNRMEANMVGARGCPYDCSFCGAAISANPDITIRVRAPANILGEMRQLHGRYGVTAFRFVDDLFLGAGRVIDTMLKAFAAERVGDWAVWDATGRINVLDRVSDATLDDLAAAGLREVALGIESGSTRILQYIDKRIDPAMIKRAIARLVQRGINVKGYFILGFPGETRAELESTVALIRHLWNETDQRPGRFRASVFEFRPYPGTPEWDRLIATGRYEKNRLLEYAAVDLTDSGHDQAMLERDEFNFSVNIQFSESSVDEVRQHLLTLTHEQHDRLGVVA